MGALEAWIRDELQAVVVRHLGTLHPGATASILVFRIRTNSGEHDLVAKVYDRDLPSNEAQASVASEFAALLAAGNAGLPVPIPLCADAIGTAIGSPLIVMSRLVGRPIITPTIPEWLEGLADTLGLIVAADVPLGELPTTTSWVDVNRDRPGWFTDQGLWSAALQRLTEGLKGGRVGFLHRDFHQGNVLWDRGQVSGVVDWVHGSKGPIAYDIGHARVNIALVAGHQAADDFLRSCGDLCLDYQRAWDLETAVSLVPNVESLLGFNAFGAELTLPDIHQTLMEITRRALA